MAYNVTIDKQPTGEIFLKSEWTSPITLTSVGQEAIVTIKDISGLISLSNIVTDYNGENNTRKLKMYYRIARSDRPNMWTEWEELDPVGESNCFTDVTPFYDYIIEIKFVRTGSNDTGELNITNFVWEGTWNVNNIDQPIFDLTPGVSPIIFSPTDTYKVFKLDRYELAARNTTNLNIEYRISQNNKRSWTEWTLLTNDNIKTQKIDPIRFFNIQYKFEHTGSSGTIQVADLALLGDFINITQNYETANAVGLREDCKNGVFGAPKGDNNLSMGSELDNEKSVWSVMECDPDSLFNPYKLGEAIDMFDKLANDATKIGGWTVEYFRTDPDENGIDHSIHEYSLHGVVDSGDIKILVPDNQFPSNQVAFNQFDLALLESFEVHLTKQEFKNVFGIQYRPKKQDFLWFCDISRMYRIEHAQAIRDFGNSSVYYKLILGKYNERANVKPTTSTLQERISSIVKNSTLEELFGTDKKADQREVAFKEQHETLSNTRERIRSSIFAKVETELIDNAEIVLSKYHYNLSGIQEGNNAVVYQNSDRYLQAGKNRSFISWFKLMDYADSDVYNLLDNYNSDLYKGYKFDITDGNLVTKINRYTYTLDVSNYLDDDIWFCVLINIDQRQRKISHYLYKRDVDREIDAKNLNNTKLRLLTSNELSHTPVEYELDPNDLTMRITGSMMRITNIRVFDDIIPEDQHTKILNQQIIRDTDHSILADNANKIYYLPNFPYHGSDPKTVKE